jgi:MGT family glycosyltransferase
VKLLFFNIPAVGHVQPTIPLARALVARGHRIVYYDTVPFAERLIGTGVEFKSYELDYDWEPGQDVLAPFDAMGRILDESLRVIPQVFDAAREFDPDCVIYDSMCPWGRQVAQRLHKPAMCSCSIMFVGRRNFRAWPRNTRLTRAMMRRPHAVARGLARYYRAAFRLRRRYGVTSPHFMDFFGNPGDRTLAFTSREFQVGGSLLGETFRFVGPMILPRGERADDILDWARGRPIIYVSLGTLFNNRADFFRTCIDAFSDGRYALAVSFGTRIDPASLGVLPPNVIARPYMPQLALLEHVRLFITHAGMNSVQEAAWCGKPMLLVPQVGDQLFIAQRVAEFGAGRLLDSYAATPANLRLESESVVRDTSYTEASRALGNTLKSAGGLSRALAEVEAFAESQAPAGKKASAVAGGMATTDY